jgi:hypothetical protein
MEIMLGMRQEVIESGPMVSSPFNTLEVEILKKLASAASKGATEDMEESAPEPIRQPKKTTLNSISSKSKAKPQPRPVQKKVEPLKRAKPQPKSNLPKEFEPEYEPLDKDPSTMTQEELDERNRQAAERQAGRKAAMPKDRAPFPDYAQMEAMALSQVSRATSTSGKGNLSALIVANLKNAGKM